MILAASDVSSYQYAALDLLECRPDKIELISVVCGILYNKELDQYIKDRLLVL
jgi:hypothetical protein